MITTGEGGMALTNDGHLAERLRRLRSHGVTRDKENFLNVPDGRWYYEQIELGYNFRLTDFAAALGLSQLDRLDRFISTRNGLADVYGELFSNTGVRVPEIDEDIRSSFHLYIVQVQLDPLQKRALFDLMHERGIGLNVHYIPIYRQPFFARMGFSSAEFPAAEMYYSSAISIPMYVELTFTQQKYVVDSLLESLEEVCSQRP